MTARTFSNYDEMVLYNVGYAKHPSTMILAVAHDPSALYHIIE
jgi:hypothetical protein